MLQPIYATRFGRDLKKLEKRGKDLNGDTSSGMWASRPRLAGNSRGRLFHTFPIARIYLDKIKTVIQPICGEGRLPEKLKDHALKGDWKGCRDCHVEPDWILIYAIDEDEGTASFIRTGSHSGMF